MFIVCGFTLCFVFSWNSKDPINEQIVAISKITLQSVISGFVTFLGLLMTISFNEYQRKLDDRIRICPVFYFEPTEKASVLIKQKKINDKTYYQCTHAKSVRTIVCVLGNSKDCLAKNIYIKISRHFKKN